MKQVIVDCRLSQVQSAGNFISGQTRFFERFLKPVGRVGAERDGSRSDKSGHRSYPSDHNEIPLKPERPAAMLRYFDDSPPTSRLALSTSLSIANGLRR